MEKGKRIYVKTRYLEGFATVKHIEACAFYPIQVEMDSPDPDGHRIHRVAYQECLSEQPKAEGLIISPQLPEIKVEEPIASNITEEKQMSFFDLI